MPCLPKTGYQSLSAALRCKGMEVCARRVKLYRLLEHRNERCERIGVDNLAKRRASQSDVRPRGLLQAHAFRLLPSGNAGRPTRRQEYSARWRVCELRAALGRSPHCALATTQNNGA